MTDLPDDKDLVGHLLEEVIGIFEEHSIKSRIVCNNNKPLVVSRDYKPERRNLSIADSILFGDKIVVAITRG